MRLIAALLLAAFLTGGCSKPPPRGLLQYLHQVAPYEKSLGQRMQEMRTIPTLPAQERGAFADHLLADVRAEHARLEALPSPPAGAKLRVNLLALYRTLEGYLARAASGTGDPQDPELQRLSAEWKQELAVTQSELESLSSFVGSK